MNRVLGVRVFALVMVVSAFAHAELRGAQLLEGAVDSSAGKVTVQSATARYLLSNRVELELEQGTAISAGTPTRLRLRLEAPTITVPTLRLQSGALRVHVPKEQTDGVAVLINAPRRVSLLVKAGSGLLRVTNESLTVASRDGENIVTIDATPKALQHGEARTFSDAQPDGPKRAILESPKGLAFKRGLVLSGDAGHLSWNPLEHAAAYLVDVTSPDNKQTRVSVTEPKFVLPNVNAGSYRVRVAAVDEHGLSSPPSEEVVLSVLQISLPQDAQRAHDGTILLKRHQSIRLVGAERLELAFGNDTEFVTAPEYISLAQPQPTKVRLRAPGESTPIELEIEPLTPTAVIEVQARGKHFPATGLPVRVLLRTLSGRPLPSAVPVSLAVSVNMRKPKLDWTREGATLRTVIPHPKDDGPWVVRVNLHDSEGKVVRHEVVELNKR
jgi:hypothetical protein